METDYGWWMILMLVLGTISIFFHLYNVWKRGELLRGFWDGLKTVALILLVVITLIVIVTFVPEWILVLYVVGFVIYLIAASVPLMFSKTGRPVDDGFYDRNDVC